MKRTAIALMASIGLLAAAQPALAESVAVTFKDLDLSTNAGREELDRRINSAAREACGFNEERTGSRMVTQDARDCYKDARKQIENRVAMLTQTKVAGR